jgi:hypothetical protein
MEPSVIADGIPVVPRNRNSRNSVLILSGEEKITRNSVPWNKNRSKLLIFCSKPFCGRKQNLEFRSVEPKLKQTPRLPFRTFRGRAHNSQFLSVQQKIETNSRNTVRNHSAEEKPTQGSLKFLKYCQKRQLMMYIQIILFSYFAAVS